MSLLNQPSRILISGDDSEWSNAGSTGGQTINLTLPESVVGALGVDCARAVIPNTLYPIPAYQSVFYWTLGSEVVALPCNVNRNFTSPTDLVTQLNADAIAAGQPLVFSYNQDTCRISVQANAASPLISVNNQNKWLVVSIPGGGGGIVSKIGSMATGIYTTTAFASAANSLFNNLMNQIGASGNYSLNGSYNSVFTTLSGPTNAYLDFTNTQLNNTAIRALYGFNQSTSTVLLSGTVVSPNASAVTSVWGVAGKSLWPTKFAMNTRLGFPNSYSDTSIFNAPLSGTFLPNLIRTRVVYILTNFSVNDSITTDGLRNVLAKVPTNSAFGGLTVYSQQADYQFSRILPSTLQNLQLSLLDENYEPYPLKYEEPMEVELVFKYAEA